mmetsp:Transcript_1802/g.2480  ORF Transcript_1802/g.2480 Transcript_1802/m.2480 type:complete len:175 (+) Transcript_1802:162-686(+)|eukprot:CAMPEP_0178916956 /NCGR_PEP_ID=MMETSP0786-20121207/12961_1 /TAXON_ID=186022 /ORGANISM="Thalassionema frauenfeldii, Strain CCMP 1798" /LENGTH=174 /DNA_ID=CAMNT_0020590417 /DNA_START=130 /DNA_END=654 /DNA_ORIENTATION=-
MALDDLDFTNHMEEIRKMEAKRERNEAMFSAHEAWQRSTISGWLVTQSLAVGNHFRPFFKIISGSLSDDQSIGKRLLSLFLRLAVIAMFFLVMIACARIAQIIVGEEIQAVDEIVVVEEIPRSRAEKEGIVEEEKVLNGKEAKEYLAKLKREQQGVAVVEEKSTRRSARDKKTQ